MHDRDLISIINDKKEEEVLNILSIYTKERLEKGIEYDRKICTVLTECVRNNLYNSVKILLQKGVNPDGISKNEGYPFESSILCASYIENFYHFKKMIRLLLFYGANINTTGISRISPIRHTINNYEKVEFLLKRGANPNTTREMLPIEAVFFNYRLNKENSKNIIELLIKYGANPYIKNRYGYSVYDMCIKDNIDFSVFEYTEEKCVESDSQDYKKRKIDSNKYVKERKTLEYVNDYTIMGDSIQEINEKYLIIYNENDKNWAFHMDEISNLLHTQKNPYTSKKLDESFINRLIITDYLPSNIQLDKKNIKYTDDIRLQLLTDLVQTLNPYIQTQKLKELPDIFLKELYKLVTDIDDIILLENCTLYSLLLKKILNSLFSGEIFISKFIYLVEQTITDYLVHKELIKLIDDYCISHEEIKQVPFGRVNEIYGNALYISICNLFNYRYKTRRYEYYWGEICRFL